MSEKVFISPGKYVQGKNVIDKTGEYVKPLGHTALVIADKLVWEIAADRVVKSLELADITAVKIEFQGEASKNEVNRIVDQGRSAQVDIVIGVGGGKTLDTAKAVNELLGSSVVIIPTTASTDAPTSALSVLYTDEGAFDTYSFFSKNPSLILVDTKSYLKHRPCSSPQALQMPWRRGLKPVRSLKLAQRQWLVVCQPWRQKPLRPSVRKFFSITDCRLTNP